MYYNIGIFLQFVVTPTKCTINTMDLKNFPSIIMLLEVNRFEGFSNQSSADELWSIWMYVTVTITNLIIKINYVQLSMKTVFSYSEYFLSKIINTL